MGKRPTIFCLILTLLGLSLLPVKGQAKDVTVGIPHNPPLIFYKTKGSPQGILPAVALKALEKMGHRPIFRPLPFGRMYKWLHSGKIDMALSVLATPQRQKKAYYSDPIIIEKLNLAVSQQANMSLNISKIAKRDICGIIGFSYPTLTFTPQNMVLEKDYPSCLSSLTKGQVDGVIIGSITGPHIIQTAWLADQIMLLPDAIGSVKIGAALSHKAFSPQDLIQFNQHVNEILQSPYGQRLLAPYQ
ncbi:transporter substrate-binding domain-containing protein [Terasakiella sp. SH-1]|uniref:substrate-binding periplasmic protein n=1 Tax=Terasakiella sp. SH-1 TaxID=2560057 RepID=UPI001072FA20|nr:transporter substrate-binding domain-containing protein [Terasakiella sp. SH-1]